MGTITNYNLFLFLYKEELRKLDLCEYLESVELSLGRVLTIDETETLLDLLENKKTD